MLYPIFKEEVYRRRATMGRIARRTSLLFISLSVLLLFFSVRQDLSLALKALVVAGIVLYAMLLIYQIIQEKSRHEKAKRQLITLERGLGFFKEGQYLAKEQLYPSEWQERPNLDQGLFVMCLSVVCAAMVLILTILSL